MFYPLCLQLYNGGTQVLAAVRYPPLIQPATTIDTLVSNLDHGPAFLELAGKEPGYNLDGMSWVPLMSPDGQEKQVGTCAPSRQSFST